MHIGNLFHDNKNDTTCYIYIYYAYILFLLFLPFSAYPKSQTAFLKEREDDEDDSACLSWKEILSLVDKYHKVNSFLVEHVTLIQKNFILPKSWTFCIIRIDLMERWTHGQRSYAQGMVASMREVWEE